MCKKFEIPQLSIEEILARYEKITPIVRNKMYTPYYLKDLTEHELTKTSYLALKDKANEKANLEEMYPICTMKMLHKWGYYGFFKPSVSEVLSQIPDLLLNKVVAFEIVKQKSMDEHKEELNAGYHVSEVILYGKIGEKYAIY